MSKFIWVDNPTALQNLIDRLQTETIIAVDTESDSLYSYFEKVCLIQMSIAAADYVIDPLAVDITPLAPIFAAQTIQKIFHAAEYDIISLRRDYGFQFGNVFDTMLAARILGWPQCGLGNILQTCFNVKLNKKFQQHNWGQRPLSRQALHYARLDTRYLARLRTLQLQELKDRGRYEEAQAAFRRITGVKAAPKQFNPADFWRIKGVKMLAPAEQAVFQALFVFRDERARYADRPPFKVMSDYAMHQLAQNRPDSMTALKKIKGLNLNLAAEYGPEILLLLRQATPVSPRMPRQGAAGKLNGRVILRYEHLRAWRNEVAQKKGVEPDVVLTNEVLKAIAKTNPATCTQLKAKNILGSWQFETYSQAIINTLASFRQ